LYVFFFFCFLMRPPSELAAYSSHSIPFYGARGDFICHKLLSAAQLRTPPHRHQGVTRIRWQPIGVYFVQGKKPDGSLQQWIKKATLPNHIDSHVNEIAPETEIEFTVLFPENCGEKISITEEVKRKSQPVY
jgi:hypothetical protein